MESVLSFAKLPTKSDGEAHEFDRNAQMRSEGRSGTMWRLLMQLAPELPRASRMWLMP